MNFVKRAILSIIHYWKTSALLVVLFTVIATLLLSGLCIKRAAQKQTAAIRRMLGGSVTLSGVIEDSGEVENLLPLSQLQKISTLPHVKSHLYVISCEGEPKGLHTVSDDISSGTTLVGVNDSDLHEKFTDGSFSISSGRALHESDIKTNNAVLSEDFAKLNHLALGDTITVVSEGKTAGLKVIGLFKENKKDSNHYGNSIYVPYYVVDGLTGRQGFYHAVFTIDDPLYISNFRTSVVNLGFGIKDTQLNANDSAYSQLSDPINSLEYISTVMVYILLIAGVAIFTLIILLNLRGRKFEIGVLLSMGEKRLKIIGQLALESLIPIIIAFSLSVGTGSIATQSIGNVMFSAQTSQQTQAVTEEGQTFKAPDRITVQVAPENTAILYISGLLIALVSVTASSVLIMRCHPKDILAQNE